MAYATINDVQARLTRTLSADEQTVCASLLDDAAIIIDAYNANASADAKKTVSCRMVARALGDGTDAGIPMGATQGSMSALGYSQSWTIGSGSAGELYIGKLEKKILGAGNAIGSYSPVQELVPEEAEA
ncbi:MAG: hypothetical protein IIZ78_12725 [Clostridiales bacterium]|nr:hypothetical protein [Clostridiales bacterium]